MSASRSDRRTPRLRVYRKHRGLLLMILPGLAFLTVFMYVPMGGVILAFKDYSMSDGILTSPWNGTENLRLLFFNKDFGRAIRNTLIISFLRLSFGFFAPIVLALMLNELRLFWYKRSVQTLTYLPHFFSWVILGSIFLMLLNRDGPINSLLDDAGYGGVDFLTDRVWFIFVLVATGIWKSAGYGSIIYLAALSGIDPTLYEAARVDGANRWQQTWHITLPCLVPTMIVLLILSLGGILNAGFDQIYNMYNPHVYETADIIDTYVLRRMFAMDFALGTAAGLFKGVVGMILIVGANWLARRLSRGEQGIW